MEAGDINSDGLRNNFKFIYIKKQALIIKSLRIIFDLILKNKITRLLFTNAVFFATKRFTNENRSK